MPAAHGTGPQPQQSQFGASTPGRARTRNWWALSQAERRVAPESDTKVTAGLVGCCRRGCARPRSEPGPGERSRAWHSKPPRPGHPPRLTSLAAR
eukprot:7032044-Prymnesium_polylepis.1